MSFVKGYDGLLWADSLILASKNGFVIFEGP